PELDQRVRHAAAGLVQHAAMDYDALADGIAILGVVADQIIVERAEIVVAEHRTRDLRDRVLDRQQRLARRAQHRGFVAGRMCRWMDRAVALEEAAVARRE